MIRRYKEGKGKLIYPFLLLLILPLISAALISIEKDDYLLGENVTINVTYQENTELFINTGQNVFKLLDGSDQSIVFIPPNPGTYTINVQDRTSRKILESRDFFVYEPNSNAEEVPEKTEDYLYLYKNSFAVNEEVNIVVNHRESDFILVLKSGTDSFKYLGSLETEVKFVPRSPGSYVIELYTADNILLDKTEFVVGTEELLPVVEQPANIMQQLNALEKPKFKIKDSKDKLVLSNIRFKKKDLTVVEKNLLDVQDFKEYGLYDEIEIVPAAVHVKRINLKNINYKENFELGIAKVSPEQGIKLEKGRLIRGFAIDPEQLEFEQASFTFEAVGTELYKCAEWNFDMQICYGTWQKVMDLTPGQEAVVAFDSTDPAYVEAGVATINSRKPYYHPNETAEFYVAVLDKQGRLVENADVNITITDPNGYSLKKKSSSGEVVEVSRGIYYAEHDETSAEGHYLVFVEAKASGLNQTQVSSFEVRTFYEFDLVRSLLLSVDPYKGPFYETIFITPLINISNYTLIEEIPENITLLEYVGAELIETNITTSLRWGNLSGNTSLTYKADPIKQTPAMIELGPSIVEYNGLEFEEKRKWLVALDPVETLSPVTDGDSELAGVDMTSQQIDDITDDDTSVVDVVRGAANVMTVEMSNITEQIDSVNDFDCELTYTSGAISPDGIFEVRDDIGGNSLGSTNIPASGVDNTVYVNDIQNDADFQISDVNNINILVENQDTGKPADIQVDQIKCTITYVPVDNNAPVIGLQQPLNDTINNSATIDFYYYVYEDRNLLNCSLVLNDLKYTTDNNPTPNSTNNITVSLADGGYNWTINCSDSSDNEGTNDSVRSLIVDKTQPAVFDLNWPFNDTVSTVLQPNLTWTQTSDNNFLNYTLLLDQDQGFPSPDRKYLITDITQINKTPPTILNANTKYYWIVVAYDRAGNIRNSTSVYTYITDTIAPSAINLVAPSNKTVSTNRSPHLDWDDTIEANFDNYTIEFDDSPAFDNPEHRYYAYVRRFSDYDIGLGEQLNDNILFYWRVIAYDRAGQSTTSPMFTYTTDNINPQLVLISPQNTSYLYNVSIPITYTVYDANIDFCKYSLDGAANVTLAGCANSTFDTQEGNHTLTLYTMDKAGNQNISEASFIVDLNDPDIVLNTPHTGTAETNSFIVFNYTPTDLYLKGCALWTNFSGPWAEEDDDPNPESGEWNFFNLTVNDGDYIWNVVCDDEASRSGSGAANYTLQVDTKEPSIGLTGPANDTVEENTNNLFFNYTVTDLVTSVSSCELIINGTVEDTDNTITEGIVQVFPFYLDNGYYNWSINCTDANGLENNSETRNLTVNVINDFDPPLITLKKPIEDQYYSTNQVNFSYKPEDATGIQNCSIYIDSTYNQTDYAVENAQTNYFNLTDFTEATHTWFINCTDNSTNENEGTVTAKNFTIDLTQPEAFDLSTPSNGTVSSDNTQDLGWSKSSDSGFANYTVQLSGSESFAYINYTYTTYGPDANAQTTGALADGKYYWRVYALDKANNSRFSTNIYELTIDTKKPKLDLDSPANRTYNYSSGIPLRYRVFDQNLDTCYYKLDGGSSTIIANCDNTTLNVNDGSHPITLYVNDTANNKNQTSVSFYVDSLDPQLTLEDPNNNDFINSETVVFNYTPIDNSLNTCILWANFSGSWAENESDSSPDNNSINSLAVPLDDGTYIWNVWCNDSAGRNAYAAANYTVKVDANPPLYSNVSYKPDMPVYYEKNRKYEFNVSWTDIFLDTVYITHNFTNGFVDYDLINNDGNYNFSLPTLAAGNYTFYWTANDSAGNINQTDQYYYYVGKENSTLNLTLDGENQNLTINESTIVNLTGVLLDGEKRIYLYKNGTQINFGWSPITSLYNFSIPGYYNISLRHASSRNYTASTVTYFVNVSDIYAPTVNLMKPDNQTTDFDGDVVFKYNVSDTGNIFNCTLYINETAYANDTSVTIGVEQSFPTQQLTSGFYVWYVNCTDKGQNTGQSEIRELTVQILTYYDDILPTACVDSGTCLVTNINQSDQTYEGHGNMVSSSPNYVNVTLEKNSYRLGSTIDYMNITWEKYQDHSSGTFYIEWRNGSKWVSICSQPFTDSSEASPDDVFCNFSSSAYPTIEQLNDGLELRGNFYYTASQGGRPFGTDYVSVGIKYTEDGTPPSIILDDPSNYGKRGAGNVTFTYTPSDPNLYNCSLWGNFSGAWERNQSNSSPISDTENNFTAPLSMGLYIWNVECWDIAGNFDYASNNFTLNITRPDLTLSSSNISFNESSPIEAENVTIYAAIYNNGLTKAEDVLVQFYRNDPTSGGTQLGSNISIPSLSGQSNTTVSISFITDVGGNNIFVVVDGNSSILEEDEDNNKANNTLNVLSYHYFYGTINASIVLGDIFNYTQFEVINISLVSGNIYFVDAESTIQFDALQALGRNTIGAPTGDDFSELDSVLNMSGFVDSINAVWADNSDNPPVTQTFNIYGENIYNVPIVNSTNTSDFVTGIMWDMSDDSPSNTQFDSTTQEDIVFVTKINRGKTGLYGTYDYELKIPARLRDYETTGGYLIIYVELT